MRSLLSVFRGRREVGIRGVCILGDTSPAFRPLYICYDTISFARHPKVHPPSRKSDHKQSFDNGIIDRENVSCQGGLGEHSHTRKQCRRRFYFCESKSMIPFRPLSDLSLSWSIYKHTVNIQTPGLVGFEFRNHVFRPYEPETKFRRCYSRSKTPVFQ